MSYSMFPLVFTSFPPLILSTCNHVYSHSQLSLSHMSREMAKQGKMLALHHWSDAHAYENAGEMQCSLGS